MPYLVNSAPGAGRRSEPSVTLDDANAALAWAEGLAKRGMRLIRIKDMTTGQVFDEASLRSELKRAHDPDET